MKSLDEFLEFLNKDARLDLKAVALAHVLSLTGSDDGKALIIGCEPALRAILKLTEDAAEVIAKDSALCLVNITAEQSGTEALLKLTNGFIVKTALKHTKFKNILLIVRRPELKYTDLPLSYHIISPGKLYVNLHLDYKLFSGTERSVLPVKLFSCLPFITYYLKMGLELDIFDQESVLADAFCMILSNLSRPACFVEDVLDGLADDTESCDTSNASIKNKLDKLVSCFTKNNYNKQKGKLHYLGPVFSNFSQSPRGRNFLGAPDRDLLSRLLPFTSHEDSIVRRGGAIGLLRNLCFDKTRHPHLLGQTDTMVDVLPFILLPLAGPEEFDDEDNDKFPPELQYLGPNKIREHAPDLRVMLLECLAQLCATREAREILRARGTYEILRELHKWESEQAKLEGNDRAPLLACENVVDILIRTEDEIGHDDLKSLDVPEDLTVKFEKMDKDYLEDSIKNVST